MKSPKSVDLEKVANRQGLTITRLQPDIGAEISGIDLRLPLNDDLRDLLYAAMMKYRVIFFRDQQLNRQQHVALGRNFGRLEVHPLHQEDEYPEILSL